MLLRYGHIKQHGRRKGDTYGWGKSTCCFVSHRPAYQWQAKPVYFIAKDAALQQSAVCFKMKNRRLFHCF